MKLSIGNLNHCLHCGKQLSLLHLLLDWLYCNSAHKAAHVRQVNKLALARLVEARQSLKTGSQESQGQPGQVQIISAVVNS